MMRRFAAFGLFGLLALCLFALPLQAQTSEASRTAVHPWYDLAKEVTFTATVSSVVKSPTRDMNMLAGSHLILETSSGTVDASLGSFAMRGKEALSVTPGARIQVTGEMKTVRGKQVLITRLVLANGRTYQIRNAHGFAIARVPPKAGSSSDVEGGRL